MANKQTTTTEIAHATLSIDALAPHPRNYRTHPEQQLGRIAASLARFGQVRSIVVQAGAPGRYLIVAGHGVVEAARGQGLTALHADIIPAEWTPAQIEGYLVADNMAGADDDLVALAELLEGQASAGYPLETVGYDAGELAALLEELAQAADSAGGERTTDLNAPAGGDVGNSWQVVAECANENEQRRVYDLLTSEGHTCRVLTL